MATHIIASILPQKKTVDFNKYRIVKPAWVTESIQAGKLLPWSDYRVIEETPRQKTFKANGGCLVVQSGPQSSPLSGYRQQSKKSFYTNQIQRFAEAIDGKRDNDASSPAKVWKTPNQPANHTSVLDSHRSLREISPPDTQGSLDHEDVSLVQHPDAAQNPVTRQDDHGIQEPAAGSPEIPKPMTSEEHNAVLLRDPKLRKCSTANPDFIQQYYAESRLHHLSTWKAELKSRMQKLAAEKGPQANPPKWNPGTRRYIMHVDFDSFFCAVSLKNAPQFVDKPTVVAHSAGNGSEIASCNYPARKHGVKNGMWMKRAKDLCPDLNVLSYDFPAYEEASRLFYESVLEIGGKVQSVSIDEALVDVTSIVRKAAGSSGGGADEGSIWREQEKVDQIALELRNRIKTTTGCAVSVGIGGNILLAKVALRKAKPAGQFQSKPNDVQDILGELKVDELPGVAYSTAGKLEEIGVKYVKDIRHVSKERLAGALGPKTGERLWEYARGIDRTEVGDQPIRKSVSSEVNWGIRFITQEEAEVFVFNLCKELERRLLNGQAKGKQLTMKIMRRAADAPLNPPKHLGHGKCDTFNKSVLFGVATHNAQVLAKEAVSILRSYNFSAGDLRGLGVQMTKLEPIKSATGPDGSQKRLSFGPFKGPTSATKTLQDPILDRGSPERPSPSHNDPKDPIVDGPITPRKPKPNSMHPAFTIAKANEGDAKAKTPLNITGTQFMMPTNPNPSVVSELPSGVRSRLFAQGRRASALREVTPVVRSRTYSPAVGDEIWPDVDLDVFHTLPNDVKAEVLASYRPAALAQNCPPQSPRKDRLIQITKNTTPTKRRGPGRPPGARERMSDANAKIKQTSFLFTKQGGEDGSATVTGSETDDSDPEFLSELPEVRRESIANHRQRKAKRSGLDIWTNHDESLQVAQGNDETLPCNQPPLQFAPRPAKVSFSNLALTSPVEIMDMLTTWHEQTQHNGPNLGDALLLEEYFAKIVLEDQDMVKAAKLVRWLEYLVDQDERASGGKVKWRAVAQGVKDEVQKAVQSRGIEPLDI